jgi:hypothetical protein
MIILETTLPIAKCRCITEMRVLDIETNSIITQAVIDRINHAAEYHEQRHRGHEVEVTIYNKAPEVVEIPE